MNTAIPALPDDAFQPLDRHNIVLTTDTTTHGNLWRDVWHDLKYNPSAMSGLALMTFLILFCQFGSWFWRVDAATMDMQQISQSPHFGMVSLAVVPAPFTAPPQTSIERLQNIHTAHTESVALVWPMQTGERVRVYRHELPPSGPDDLGLPLTETTDYFLQDQLRLENRTYFYSIARLDAQRHITDYQTLAVDVAHATVVSSLPENASQVLRLPAHPLGTDKLGRDLLARIMAGGQVSLFIGLVAPLVFVLFGTLYGALAGYLGGRIDAVMMAMADFIIALPFLLFMILLRVAFGIGPGESGIHALLFALVILSWPNTARLVRGQVLQLRSSPYVDAARLQGANSLYIVTRHLLPNVLPAILVTLSFAIPSAIFTEAFLSFIGLGVVPPTPSWGSLCNDGLSSLLMHPHELLFPAVFISLAVLAFNLFGDGLRDALDIQARDQRQSA
jgi:oligopeptide transport system permease protein